MKRGAADQAVDDLRWLGLDWDDGPVLQSDRRPAHRAAIDALLAAGRAYPCVCTRAEVDRAASAPHADDGASVYPGTCRDRFASVDEAGQQSGREPAIRFRVDDDRVVRWADGFAGEQAIRLGALGDFVIAKSDGTPSYQLAVVVDDRDAGVTHVIRGDDLIDSTPRQLALYEALGSKATPSYFHLPLLVGADGRRLAKRHGDSRLSSYRSRGTSVATILQRLATWSGIERVDDVRIAGDLIDRFELAHLPRGPIVVETDFL